MKTTAISEISDMEDKLPVLAVEGTVKVAMAVQHSPSDAQKEWSRQFFVLAQGSDEVGCTLWDAEGNEMTKGETVRIENTQNKKGQWSGMLKGSYEKQGKTHHTLEIRANQVKIKVLGGGEREPGEAENPLAGRDDPPSDPDWPEAPKPQLDDGVTEARKHIMQSANLYVLCVNAVEKYCAAHFPEVARTSEMFQAAVGTLFIEASRNGLVNKMPQTPIK